MTARTRAGAALLSLFLFLALLTACKSGGGYRIVDTFSDEGSYVIAFREGDRLCELVTAALRELQANGSLRALSRRWFGEDLSLVSAQSGAMDELWGEVPDRQVTVGVDISNVPMSYESPDGYMGYDIDVANYVCSFLGLRMNIYPIDPADVDVELQSGNIDMAMGVSEKDETDDFSYSPAYLTSRYVLVARVTGQVKDRSALKGRTLGVTVTDLDVLQQDQKFVESLGAVVYQTNTDGLFQALLNREVDGILVSSVVAAYYMNL